MLPRSTAFKGANAQQWKLYVCLVEEAFCHLNQIVFPMSERTAKHLLLVHHSTLSEERANTIPASNVHTRKPEPKVYMRRNSTHCEGGSVARQQPSMMHVLLNHKKLDSRCRAIGEPIKKAIINHS